MAQEGHNTAEILSAVEWRSKAFLRYCDVDSVDPKELFAATLDSSEDEGENSVILAANNSAVVAK